VAVAALLLPVAPAVAGQAATGELLFYPCTSCHPVTAADVQSGRQLPNGFKGHQVVLVTHDALGQGRSACLVCHDDPSRNPEKLKLIDGSLIEITGDVSLVCYRCHSAKYKEWKAGTHGRNQPKCTASGCHNPHSPGWIYAPPLMPFIGTGFQVHVLPQRQRFMPLASPPGNPPVETPTWFMVAAALGVVLAGGVAGKLIQGRSKQ
jgi:hypothetical protein